MVYITHTNTHIHIYIYLYIHIYIYIDTIHTIGIRSLVSIDLAVPQRPSPNQALGLITPTSGSAECLKQTPGVFLKIGEPSRFPFL